MNRQNIADKNILVVGMARSGLAAAKALHEMGINVTCQDSNPKLKPETEAYLKEANIPYYLGETPDLHVFDIMVLSPGVPLTIDLVQDGIAAGIKVIGELELAYMLSDADFVSITGTNGKTTTTTLVGEMFKAAGMDSSVAGNIGIPVVSKAVSAKADSWLIVETSSFQAETIDEFHPGISTFLNLGPDHLDRHKTFANYANSKAKIFKNQTMDDYAVVNADDPYIMKLIEGISAKVVPFSRLRDLDFGAFVMDEEIVIRNEEGKVIFFCNVGDLMIPGTHNLENALAATATAYFAGVDVEGIKKALITFAGVEHRIEKCGVVNGVTYINDSKGTNPDAAIKAIQAVDGKVILIAGGYDKGADYTEFVNALAGKVKHVILMGKTAVKIKNACEKAGFDKTVIVKDMKDCVKEAARIAGSGETVLLSPACASWDMYDNFETRGRDFKNCVRSLEK